MVVSSVDIKKSLIHVIVDFKDKIDLYKSEYKVSDRQSIELLSVAKEIYQLIDALSLGSSLEEKGIKAPNVSADEYAKLKRVLDLSFRNKSDINVVAIDIGEKLAYTNQLLQSGIEYLLLNLKDKRFANLVVDDFKSETKTQTKKVKLEPRPVQEPVQKKKGGSLFAKLLFFLLLVGGGYAVYNSLFNQHATKVTSLVKEYRADEELSATKRPETYKTIKVYGSSSLISSIKKWQGNFKSKYQDLGLEIETGDSSFAIARLLDGEVTIAASSRIPSIKERKKSQKIGKLLGDHKVALDAVAVFVHPSNPVKSLSVEDLKKIFSTNSETWWGYGGNQIKLNKYSPNPQSGTFYFFKDRVMFHEEFSEDVIKMFDINQLIEMVENDPSAIGFSSISNVRGRNVKLVPLTTFFNKESGVKPLTNDGLINSQAIKRGDYPLTRYLYLLTAGELDDASAKFIDYFRSEEGQRILNSVGLVSIY